MAGTIPGEELLSSILLLKQQLTTALETVESLRLAVEGSSASKASTANSSRKAKLQLAESLPANQLGSLPPIGDDWPIAAAPHMIVSNKGEAERRFRAVQIVKLLHQDLTNKRVLDLGCDEGYISRELAETAHQVIGYDLKAKPSWETITAPNLRFTTNRNDVASAPYDFILLYDVLDHLEGEDPAKFLAWVQGLLVPGGTIFLRTHPWTSKHGGHLYEIGLNKAFMHLALTPDELARLGHTPPAVLRVARPQASYELLFREAGLKVLEKKAHTEPVDGYFSGNLLDRIIKITWKGAIEPAEALKIMSNSFIDYKLGA